MRLVVGRSSKNGLEGFSTLFSHVQRADRRAGPCCCARHAGPGAEPAGVRGLPNPRATQAILQWSAQDRQGGINVTDFPNTAGGEAVGRRGVRLTEILAKLPGPVRAAAGLVDLV